MEHKLCVGGRGGAGHRSLYPDNVSVSDPLTVAATRHHHQRYAAHCHRHQILLSNEDDVCFSAVSSVDIVIICIYICFNLTYEVLLSSSQLQDVIVFFLLSLLSFAGHLHFSLILILL